MYPDARQFGLHSHKTSARFDLFLFIYVCDIQQEHNVYSILNINIMLLGSPACIQPCIFFKLIIKYMDVYICVCVLIFFVFLIFVIAFLTTKMADIGTTDLWIGLNALKQDGFFWTDGKTRKYTNWGYSVNAHNMFFQFIVQKINCVLCY